MYFDIENNVLVEIRGDEEHIVIPDGMIRIEQGVFRDSKMKEVEFPESLRAIERSAFCRCKELTSVTLPAGVEHIGTFAFSACEALRMLLRGLCAAQHQNSGCSDPDWNGGFLSLPVIEQRYVARIP